MWTEQLFVILIALIFQCTYKIMEPFSKGKLNTLFQGVFQTVFVKNYNEAAATNCTNDGLVEREACIQAGALVQTDSPPVWSDERLFCR